MITRRSLMVGGVVSTFLSFVSFATMDADWVEDWSATENWLNAAGYVLVALALVLLFAAMRIQK